jgi:hypothetical protein
MTPRRRELLTTAEAAELAGMTPAGLRSTTSRVLRTTGVDLRTDRADWRDGRTPTYDATRLRAWLAARPGPPEQLAPHVNRGRSDE